MTEGNYCFITFDNEEQRNKHREEVHFASDEREGRCMLCLKHFTSFLLFTDHFKEVHQEETKMLPKIGSSMKDIRNQTCKISSWMFSVAFRVDGGDILKMEDIVQKIRKELMQIGYESDNSEEDEEEAEGDVEEGRVTEDSDKICSGESEEETDPPSVSRKRNRHTAPSEITKKPRIHLDEIQTEITGPTQDSPHPSNADNPSSRPSATAPATLPTATAASSTSQKNPSSRLHELQQQFHFPSHASDPKNIPPPGHEIEKSAFRAVLPRASTRDSPTQSTLPTSSSHPQQELQQLQSEAHLEVRRVLLEQSTQSSSSAPASSERKSQDPLPTPLMKTGLKRRKSPNSTYSFKPTQAPVKTVLPSEPEPLPNQGGFGTDAATTSNTNHSTSIVPLSLPENLEKLTKSDLKEMLLNNKGIVVHFPSEWTNEQKKEAITAIYAVANEQPSSCSISLIPNKLSSLFGNNAPPNPMEEHFLRYPRVRDCGVCPRCGVFAGSGAISRSTHYRKYHFPVYFTLDTPISRRLNNVDKWLSITLGDFSAASERVCPYCIDHKTTSIGRIDLLHHIKMHHSNLFIGIQKEYLTKFIEIGFPAENMELHNLLLSAPYGYVTMTASTEEPPSQTVNPNISSIDPVTVANPVAPLDVPLVLGDNVPTTERGATKYYIARNNAVFMSILADGGPSTGIYPYNMQTSVPIAQIPLLPDKQLPILAADAPPNSIDSDYFNGKGERNWCPRCSFFAASQTARVAHYIRFHFGIYFSIGGPTLTKSEKWLAIRLGENSADLRVCPHCIEKHCRVLFNGRLGLLNHFEKHHSDKLLSMRNEYQALFIKETTNDKAIQLLLMSSSYKQLPFFSK